MSAYRPKLVYATSELVQVRGMMPLRLGLTVEVAFPGAAGAAVVERCNCGSDGLFLIDLRMTSADSGVRTVA